MKTVVGIGALLALLVVSCIFNGIALSWLWFWFITPLGVSSIGVAQAIGICTLTRVLTDNNAEQAKVDFSAIVGKMLFLPFLVLFMGWIIHIFM